jgi:hypothetical protein
MRHIRLFELQDQQWFPSTLRASITDFISYAGQAWADGYRDFATRLHVAMARCGEHRLLDLCAGNGGPSLAIARLLREEHDYEVDLVLTDFRPNVGGWEQARKSSRRDFEFVSSPVDATRVPADAQGFRLMCNAFHHFRPEQAQAILRDAVAQRRGIALFENFDPDPLGVVQPFVITAMMFALAPFVRPFQWRRMLYTYVLPLAPASLLWDGLVSWLRIYSDVDLRELVASIDVGDAACQYEWEIGRGRVPKSPLRSIHFIGTPRQLSRPA